MFYELIPRQPWQPNHKQGITVASRSHLLNPFTDAFFHFGYESAA
jgi:hypothetical protein